MMAKTPYISLKTGEKMAIGLRYSAPDLESGETISTVACAVLPGTGLTLVGAEVIDGDEVSQVVHAVSAGEYVVTFTTTISSGQIYLDDYTVKVRA